MVSGALFSGHFGVGDVIFPAILGRDTGKPWFAAAVGYGMINSLGVLIAYLAVAQRGTTLLGMSSKTLGRGFGIVYTTIAMLIIGPVFILPRVSSATHEMSVVPFFPNFPLWATLLIYFGINFYVAFNRAKVIDRLGKVLAPLLILFIVVLILKGIFTPLANPNLPGEGSPLAGGVLNGYNTMNALGAALFGGWMLNELSRRGIKEKSDQSRNLAIIGLITAVLLLITSTGIVGIGATSGAAYPDAKIGELSVLIAEGLLGSFGKIAFAILMALACLTTSIGLTSTAGDTFQEMTGGRLKYSLIVALSSAVGFALGLVGLERIVRYTVPWLMLIYPALIVLIVGNLFPNFPRVRAAIAFGVVVALICSVGDFLSALGAAQNPISGLIAALPLGRQGLGWLAPVAVVAAIVQIVSSAAGAGREPSRTA
jgi:LIVCS family branched-chain amino acid:cation transporter